VNLSRAGEGPENEEVRKLFQKRRKGKEERGYRSPVQADASILFSGRREETGAWSGVKSPSKSFSPKGGRRGKRKENLSPLTDCSTINEKEKERSVKPPKKKKNSPCNSKKKRGGMN